MNKNPHYHYTAEEIRRYLQGEMSETEMHMLEKAALDDPMLADAIEGFQASMAIHGKGKTMQDVEALNRAFAARYHQTPVRRFPWWQVAAAAVIIIIAGIVTFTYYNKPAEQLAITQPDTANQTSQEKDISVQLPDSIVARDAAATQPFSSDPVQQRTVVTSKEITANKKKSTGNRTAAADLSRRQQKEEPAIVNPRLGDSMEIVNRDVAAPQTTRDPIAEKNQSQNNAMHLLSGRVLNSNMEPLANASLVPSNTTLQPNNSNNRLNTDNAGYFNVLSPDTSLIVKVTATGYQEQLFRLRNSPTQNNLVLKDQYKGKAAGATSARKSTKEEVSFLEQQASPQGGWTAFDAYVEKNKVYPAEASPLSGEVIISFQVNNQGKLSNFKIVQSLARGYDEEAIRLIKEGPEWKVLKGRKAFVKVTVRF